MNCIMCGKCMEVCPLLRATDREELSPRAKAVLSDLSGEDAARLAGLCLGCQRCRDKCPQGVDVPMLVARLRSEHPDFHSWLWKMWLTRSRELWPSTGLAARLLPGRMRPERLGPMLKMLADARRGPAVEPFVRVEVFGDALRGQRVALFPGCMARHVRKRWLRGALHLLEGLGAEVLPASFECCGGSLRLAGCFEDADRLNVRNVKAWRKAGEPLIVTPCASCLHSLTDYSGNVFADSDEAERWRASLRPLSGALLDCEFAVAGERPEPVGYHRPCHTVGRDTDAALVGAMLGAEPDVRTSRECCGFGGLMRLSDPDTADRAGAECARALSGAELVLTGCSACAARLPSILSEKGDAGHWIDVMMFDI